MKSDYDNLTPREKQVLKLLVKGWTNKAISEYIDVSYHTAKFHVLNIAKKLNLSSRTEIAVEAVKRGWV